MPRGLCFIENVGMHANGKTFCGSNEQQGNHWVTAMYDHSKRKLIYGDSLGWPIPDSLQQKVQLFADEIYEERSSPISLEYCHDPESHSYGRRSCGAQCRKRYPLQTCGKVPGVVALVIAAMFRPGCTGARYHFLAEKLRLYFLDSHTHWYNENRW